MDENCVPTKREKFFRTKFHTSLPDSSENDFEYLAVIQQHSGALADRTKWNSC
jgi:hypothetical protein